MSSGRLIVLEGPDGIGKSTILKRIAMRLEPCGRAVRQESFPGNGPGSLGALVYDLHHESSRHGVGDISPSALQALHIAAHLDSIENTIFPALQSGEIVLLDRFWWSAWVYGTAAMANQAALERLIEAEQAVWNQRVPDAVFLIVRAHAFRAEHHQPDFDRYLQLYREISQRERSRYPVFEVENNNLDDVIGFVFENIMKVVN